MEKEFVSRALFDEMIKKSSLGSIVENNRAIALVSVGKDFFVICGGMSSHTTGYKYVKGYKAIDLRVYKGTKKPLEYFYHFTEVDKGNRERSYCGLKIKFEKRWIVLTGPEKEFYPLEEEKQLELFQL